MKRKIANFKNNRLDIDKNLSVSFPFILPRFICLLPSLESFETQRREVKEAYEKVGRLVRPPVPTLFPFLFFRFNTSATILRKECFQRLWNPRIRCLRCLSKSQEQRQHGGKWLRSWENGCRYAKSRAHVDAALSIYYNHPVHRHRDISYATERSSALSLPGLSTFAYAEEFENVMDSTRFNERPRLLRITGGSSLMPGTWNRIRNRMDGENSRDSWYSGTMKVTQRTRTR